MKKNKNKGNNLLSRTKEEWDKCFKFGNIENLTDKKNNIEEPKPEVNTNDIISSEEEEKIGEEIINNLKEMNNELIKDIEEEKQEFVQEKPKSHFVVVLLVVIILILVVVFFVLGTEFNMRKGDLVKNETNETTNNTTEEDEEEVVEKDNYTLVNNEIENITRKDECISSAEEGLVKLFYKTKKDVSSDYSSVFEKYDYKEGTKYYCYNLVCSTNKTELEKEFRDEENETNKYYDIVFELIDNKITSTINDNFYEKEVENIKSFKVSVSSEFGYELYLLDTNNDLYYLTFLKDKFSNPELITSNVNNFAIYSDTTLEILRDSEIMVPSNELAINTNDNKVLFGYKNNLQDAKTLPYLKIYKDYKNEEESYYDVIIYLEKKLHEKSTSFEKMDKKELVINNIIFSDYKLYLIDENNSVIYYDLKDCSRKYKLYTEAKVTDIKNSKKNKKVNIYYDNNTYEEISYDYYLE